MKISITPTRPRLAVSLLSCFALTFTVQTATLAASSDILQSFPTRLSPYSNSAIAPESLAYPLPFTAAFTILRESPYPTESSSPSFFVDPRAKRALKRRAPGDNETHSGNNSGAGNGGTTTITTEEEEAEAARKAAEEAARKAAEEEAAKKKAEEDETAKKKAEEEEAAKKAAEEEEAKKKAEEEAARKATEEEAARKAAEEEEARRMAEKEAKKKAEEDEARRKAEEEEAARKAAEEEAKKKAEEEETAKKSQEEAEREAARKAAEDAEAARRAKEEADRKAAVEEAARKAREEAEKTKDKGTANDNDNEQEQGENSDNGIPNPLEGSSVTKDNSTESSKKTIMIAAIAGGAALVAAVVAGFIIRHKRDSSRRASAMEAYLGKKFELQHMGNDNDDTSTSFSRNNSNNGGQAVYSHRSNSRYAGSQQHLAHPSPRHQHANQHYDNQHYDDHDMTLPSMPTLMTTRSTAENSEQFYPQHHYENYHAVSPVLVQSGLTPQNQYDQYYQQQGHDYYSHPQDHYDEYYEQQNMYSTGIPTEKTIDPVARHSSTSVDFPLPPATAPTGVPLAIDTSSKELSSTAVGPTTAGGPGSASLTSPPPRDPHALTYSGSIISSSISLSRISSTAPATAGIKNAKGAFKRSPVTALIASEAGGDIGAEATSDERPLRRSGSVLFG